MRRHYPAIAATTVLGVVVALVAVLPAGAAAAAELPVTAVTASADDGNVPANTIDGNLATRWSALGDPQWIQFDLGQSRTVESVRIAWYRGNERQSSFDVQTSATGSAWATVHSGSSSGTTTALESYDVTDSTGRYVRVVGHGNTSNGWNSITEVKIDGSGGAPPTDPPPAGTDPNGVKQIYPTRAGKAAPWTLGFGDWQGRIELDSAAVSGSGKDTVLTNSGQVRMNVKAVPGPVCVELDQGTSLARGYMCTPNDWTNFELTGYVKLDSPAGKDTDQDWTWYGNGAHHTTDGAPEGCEGNAYKASYHYKNTQNRMSKESWHVNYDHKPWEATAGGVDYTQNLSKWLGMKFVRYEFTRNGERGVRLELWLDFGGVDASGNPANQWGSQPVRVIEDHPDQGSWGEEGSACGDIADDQIMLWGGPLVTYRWDNTASRLRLASAREIVPPSAS